MQKNLRTLAQYRRKSGSDDNLSRKSKYMNEGDSMLVNEAQLILAEKRTSLATMRAGIAVFALPLSVLGLLIATSRYYEVLHVLYLIIPLVTVCAGLIAVGGYLIVRSLVHIRRYDRMIEQLKQRHSEIAELLD
jgi:uncharacterized membrane protein YidH (DUF202 family)